MRRQLTPVVLHDDQLVVAHIHRKAGTKTTPKGAPSAQLPDLAGGLATMARNRVTLRIEERATIPVATEHTRRVRGSTAARPSPRIRSTVPSMTCRVLLVEDEVRMRIGLEDSLRIGSFEVESDEDGEETYRLTA